MLPLLTWEKLPVCSVVLPFVTGLPWHRTVLLLVAMSWRLSVMPDDQRFPCSYHMAAQVDMTASVSRFVCSLGPCDFVPQVTHLLFSRPWMVYLSLNTVVQSPAWSSSLDFVWSTLCLIVFPPLALLKRPPHSALKWIVCTKLICPVHTFPTWTFTDCLLCL